MSSTESRSGFRLPWSSDRSHESQPDETTGEPVAELVDESASSDIAWINGDSSDRPGVTPTQPRAYEPAPAARGLDAPAQVAPAAASQEPAMLDTASTPPAPVAPRKPTKLMADLSAAIRATAEAAREERLTKIDADVTAVVAEIRAGSKEGEVALKHRSDDDIAEIREWSKAEVARIKEETERRIESRRAALADEIETLADEIETRIGAVEGLATGYRGEMDAYADRLAHEDDPARLATLAESMPEPPVLAEVIEADLADLPRAAVEVEAEAEAVAAIIETAEAVAAEAWGEPAHGVETEAVEIEAVAEVVEAEAVEVQADVAEADVEAEAGVESTGAEGIAEGAIRPWGAPTPWGDPDAFTRTGDTGADTPRWVAGDAPEGFQEPAEGGDPVDRGAIMAALEAAAEAVVAAEAAAESADQAEAAADVAETAAELVVGRSGNADDLDPEAQAAFSARVDAGGFDTESFTDRLASLMPGHEPVEDDGSQRTTQVVVQGLVSVASIASFKRHLGRIPGVDAVAVASGPDGEFVFNVSHRADVSFRDALPTMPGFAARVTSTGEGVVIVTARDPEAEG